MDFMGAFEKLSQKALYQQPKYLCGPSCMIAARDILKNSFAPKPGAFQAVVTGIGQSLESQKRFNPVTISELLAVGKMIGMKTRCVALHEEVIHALGPSLIVVKIAWHGFGPIIGLAREFSDLVPEDEHYVLVTGMKESKCTLWEPAFSGLGSSPWLELTWNELRQGNLAIRFENERGKCVFIS